MILQVIFSCFKYLLLLCRPQLGGKHIHVAVRKGLYLDKDEHLVLARDDINLAAAHTEIPLYDSISLGQKICGGPILSALPLGMA